MEDLKSTKFERAGQTFIVEVKYVKNQSWQGVLTWVDKKQTVPFRSVVELIKLLDSAVGTEQIEGMEEWE